MDNKEIYKRTLPFSLRRALWDLVSLLALGGLSVAGFLIGGRVAPKSDSAPLVGLLIGLAVAIAVTVIITRYNSFANKAAQIAMMTRGVTENSLPDDVVGEGKRIVKERFTTVAGYYLVTRIINSIFSELGRGITKLGEAIGGDTGGTVGSAVSSVMQTIVRYLCDCCLGWVFFRSETTAPRATLEGAAIFFKHGKTFAKNMGRVFGIGLLTLVVIGGAFTGIIYLILHALASPVFISAVSEFFQKAADAEKPNAIINFFANPNNVTIGIAILGGVALWGIIHSVFIRPFVLVGVLRNFIASGANDVPGEAAFAKLDSISPKFRKAHAEAV